MPLLNDLSVDTDWVEPDEVPRPVVAYGFDSDTFGDFELQPHHHAKSQLLYVQRGALSCETDKGLWIVPPRSATWIPGGAVHAMRMTGALEGYAAFVSLGISERLPVVCCAMEISALLRELLIRCASLPLLYEEGGAISRPVGVLLDETAAARPDNLHLPMPSDMRLRRIVDLMMVSPADWGTLETWAAEAGMSPRTLERSIKQQTGMNFRRWR